MQFNTVYDQPGQRDTRDRRMNDDSTLNLGLGTVRQTVEKFEARRSLVLDTAIATRGTVHGVRDFNGADMGEHINPLPSPTDTPYRTPSSSRSRQTSHTYEDMSPGTTPPPLPSQYRDSKRISNESGSSGLGESLPFTDPRRFTPTLHASLVSEILSLRREAESRMTDIERLEQALDDAQLQNQTLNGNLLAANREVRQTKRQMQILEGGTLSAINELARERDDAVAAADELRNKLDLSQRKAKAEEDASELAHSQWSKDKEDWLSEKRTLETKVHIVESRLKAVLNEVTKAQLLQHSEETQSPRWSSQSRISVASSPRKRPESVNARRYSVNSIGSDTAGGRTSVLSFVHGDGPNLADELALHDIEEDMPSDHERDLETSPDMATDDVRRPASQVSLKARKVLGLPIDFDELNFQTGSVSPLQGVPVRYTEAGTQWSQPNSPSFDDERQLQTPVQRYRGSLETARASKSLSLVSQDSAHFSVDTSDNAWEENLRNLPIMVSTSCQTTEKLPDPFTLLRSESALSTIQESVETREVAVQTDEPRLQSGLEFNDRLNHRRTDTEQTASSTDLQIPTIAIIPPTSRPVTPEQHVVKLPPRTKNAGCQVESEALSCYSSVGMQTEDIRIDKRHVLLPAPTASPPPVPANLPPPSSFRHKGPSLPRRPMTSALNPSLRRVSSGSSAPVNDDGPLSESRHELSRPVRSSSMFAGFDEGDVAVGDAGDDVFDDDAFFNKPTTKFILSRGKMMSATKDLDDIEETEAAVAAGKKVALEQIRRSEEIDRDAVPETELLGELLVKLPPKTTARPTKKPSGRSNMRRTALISSGTVAHQTKSSLSSAGSGETTRPPVSIPVRYSSARVGKTSDGGRSSRASSNNSPTRNGRRASRPGLRKSRSGPAMSPASHNRRERSHSPPLEDRVSILPDAPNFRMPPSQRDVAIRPVASTASFASTAPRFSAAPQFPFAQEDTETTDSQQTSVVDAIAQTMVGEWMYKYVRRRKSFGKLERDWDPSKSIEEMTNNPSSGARHKRWVWLAPYERSVIWSSKQPTDNNALLGKSGRKLTIKSVLDVKDDNPMPKGSISGAHFNRSILILTPQRALKFTACTQERHYLWLTALSFLSHSPISLSHLAPLPALPPENRSEPNSSPGASLGGSFRRRPIRDSIRIAKHSNNKPQFRSFTTDGIPTMSEYDRPQSQEQYDPINDAAMPPVVKRYHNRKRSNTAPKPTANAFRAFLNWDSNPPVPMPITPSVAVTTERSANDRGAAPSLGARSSRTSRRGSEASAMSRPPVPPLPLGPAISSIDSIPRFMDTTSNSSHAASMTMRMDAFMAEQARQQNLRGGVGRGGFRNLRLGRPSMRNLKDASTSSWVQQDLGASYRDSMSPVDSTNLPTPTELRFSESTGRGSSEVGASYYKTH